MISARYRSGGGGLCGPLERSSALSVGDSFRVPVVMEPWIDRSALAARIGELCRLTGDFTLRSGEVASTYFDKYLFEADPELLAAIAAHMTKLVPGTTEVVAGLELGGVPVATAISLAMGIPATFVRKEAKTYGTAKLAEGTEVAGRHVLIIEDVITTGGQAATSAGQLRDRGATIDTVLCVVDRSGANHPRLDALNVSVRALFSSHDLG